MTTETIRARELLTLTHSLEFEGKLTASRADHVRQCLARRELSLILPAIARILLIASRPAPKLN